MIRDHAMGLVAQQAVSNDGTDADQSVLAIHTVLRELRKARDRLRSRPQGIRWLSPGRGLCHGVGRCRRSMKPSPHPAHAMTQNRRALAEVACVALDTDTTSWYSMRHRLVDRSAVCGRLDGWELTMFPRCIDPERPKPRCSPGARHHRSRGPGSTHDRACPPTVSRVLGTPDTLLLANSARFDLSGDR